MPAGIGNPVGAVYLADGGAPRIINGIAGASIISCGVFVNASGAEAVVISGLNSYVNTDIKFVGDASGAAFNGIAMYAAGSNEPIAVAYEGLFITLVVGSLFKSQ